jgi:hypothetical protein
VRVLIACEFSGAVRDAFAKRGHFARSVDLLPTESLPEAVRFRGDFGCMNHATFDPTCEDCEHDEPWCHRCDAYAYECACLGPTEDEAAYAADCEHGARHLAGDLFTVEDIEGYDLVIAHPPCTHLAVSGARWFKEKGSLVDDALDFVRRLMALPVRRLCIENPVSIISSRIRKPDQIIQPWQFGHGETKATCLWLRNLPPLVPTNVVSGREARVHKLPPTPDRWKLRSMTYQGIADAMADQWGALDGWVDAPAQADLFAGAL